MSAARPKKNKDADVSEDELARQRGETLPDREVMSTVSVDPQPSFDFEPDALNPTDPTPKGVS
jgi:hypothetical protein